MKREDRILKDLISGREPEKRIMVGYEGKKKKKGDIKSKLTDIMAAARMPWFCPACDKIMKKRLDNKFWRLFGQLDQIQSIENWKNQGDLEIVEPVNINTGFVHIDKYKIPKELVVEADEALEELNVTLGNVNAKLDELYAD